MKEKELQEAYAAYEIVGQVVNLQIATNSDILDVFNFELTEIGNEEVENFVSKKLLDKGYSVISNWEFTCRGYYAELEKS